MRHIIIMLDIDDTLVHFTTCAKNTLKRIKYTASYLVWYENLAGFRQLALGNDPDNPKVMVHYGIATSKPLYLSEDARSKGWQGDSISAQILAQNIHDLDNVHEGDNNNLKEFLDCELIYFVGEQVQAAQQNQTKSTKERRILSHRAKATHALSKAKAVIEKRYNTTLTEADVFLIDDNQDVCAAIAKHQFNAICVSDEFAFCNDHDLQKKIIEYIFKSLLPAYALNPLAKRHLTSEQRYDEWKFEIEEILYTPIELPSPSQSFPQPRIETMAIENSKTSPLPPAPKAHSKNKCCLFNYYRAPALPAAETVNSQKNSPL